MIKCIGVASYRKGLKGIEFLVRRISRPSVPRVICWYLGRTIAEHWMKQHQLYHTTTIVNEDEGPKLSTGSSIVHKSCSVHFKS